jgi:TPR repeat protein
MLQHPRIVLAAGKGDLATVSRLLAKGTPVDSCGRWTEVEDRGFYEKSWTWDSDTALCAAVRGGHTEVVRVLLAAGANPTFRVCNMCDVFETPHSIALEVRTVHPACAQVLLGDAFQEQQNKAEAAWAATLDSPATLLELAAHELRVVKACELVGALPLNALYSIDQMLKACAPSTLACVPEQMRKSVKRAWRCADARVKKQRTASEACLALGNLYLRGEGVALDEAAAFHWLLRGLRSRPAEHVAHCWGAHAEHPMVYQDGSCSYCDEYTDARNTLTTLAAKSAAPRLKTFFVGLLRRFTAFPEPAGAAHAAALAAEAQRSAALLDTPLHDLEMLRQDAKQRLEALHKEEVALKQAKAAELQRQQDARFAELRQREVARCALLAPQRRASGGGGECTRRKCYESDYCTYWHDEQQDLPPQCRWFQDGDKCRNGEDCWYNHLPAKPPPVPVQYLPW